MCKALEDYRIEEREEGRKEGRREGFEMGNLKRMMESARIMIADGKLSYDDIAKYSGMKLEEVRKLADEMKVSVKK